MEALRDGPVTSKSDVTEPPQGERLNIDVYFDLLFTWYLKLI